MSIQTRFFRFHEEIKLNRFDQNRILREKREHILDRLRDGLRRNFPSNKPTFTHFNQGSYEMGTGIKPLDGDYDIDVGIEFNNIKTHNYEALEVKKWVYEAVKSHTTDVRWRRPCITVFYIKSGEIKYHVDLAIYAKDNWGKTHIAMGKEYSGADLNGWELSDPRRLTNLIQTRYNGDDGKQFRRIIRYLKRWKDEHFPKEGNASPTGIGLTASAYKWFSPNKDFRSGSYNDLVALKQVVSSMIANFPGWFNNRRLVVKLPVPPHNDLFEIMTDQQMLEFESRLEHFRHNLDIASNSETPSYYLKQIFGNEFPE